MSWLDFLSRRSQKFWSAYYGGRNSTGKPINQETALTVATAWSCVRALAETAGTLPYFLYQRQKDGSREIATAHPLYKMLHVAPNPDQTARDVWEAVTGCLALQGNCYGLKQILDGKTVGLELLDPRNVQVTRNPSTYRLEYTFNFRGKVYERVGSELIVHWRGFTLGGDMGLSAVHYGANVLGIAMAADDAAGQQFRSSANGTGFIQSPKVLDKDQREQFKTRLQEFQANESSSKIMLLEGGFEWKTFGFNPNDLQMLQTRGFSIEQVCSLFRVPPFIIGHQEKSTAWGTGLEQTVQSFITFALMPYLDKIAKRNDRALLSGADIAAGYYTEFETKGLLRADSTARANLYASGAQNGWMTRAEIRELENMPRVEGSDELTAQSNLVPLDKLGEVAASGGSGEQLRQQLRAWLGVPDEQPREPSSTN